MRVAALVGLSGVGKLSFLKHLGQRIKFTHLQASDLIKLAVNIFSLVVGVIAVIMIIVAGVKYVTSSGESSNVNSAKNTILYAIIGLVIVALAQVIVRFVVHKAAPAPECQVPAAQQADSCK